MVEHSVERSRLLDLVADYCLEHGVADLTLRAVGRHAGSNNRMLLYYFGSKEQMIAAALVHAGDRFPVLRHSFDVLGDADIPLGHRLHSTWKAISAPANLPYIRLFFEVFGLAVHQPGRFDEFLGSVGRAWADNVTAVLRHEGLGPDSASQTGRQIVAMWRGLQLDLLSGAERGPIDATHQRAATRIADEVAREIG